MTSLDLLDLHFVFFTDFDQYLVQISLHLSQINDIWIWGCELKLLVRLSNNSNDFDAFEHAVANISMVVIGPC